MSPDGLVAGLYLHGLFHNVAVREALLGGLARRRGIAWTPSTEVAPDPYDCLADAVAAHVDLARLYAVCGLSIAERT